MKTLPLLATVCMIGSSIGLIGCSQPAEPDSVAAAPATSAASMSAAVTEAISKPVQISSLLPMQAYDCLPAQKITATYDRENPVESQAMLEINGRGSGRSLMSVFASTRRSSNSITPPEIWMLFS